MPRTRGRLASSWVDRHYRLLLLAPAAMLIALVAVYPVAYSVWASFVNFDFRVPGHPWVGLENYASVVNDPVAVAAFWQTAILVGAAVTLELVLGLVLALAMVRHFRGRNALMPLLIFPLFLSPVVAGQVWAILLQHNGPLDTVIDGIVGSDVTIRWTLDAPWNYIAIVLADTWQWTPFVFLILLAGLTSIPSRLYEAADVDGANFGRSLVFLTIPLLLPFILLAAILRFLDAVKLFDTVFVLTQGGPGHETFTVAFRLYEQGFRLFRVNYGAAGSWLLLLVVGLVATLLLRRMSRRLLREQ